MRRVVVTGLGSFVPSAPWNPADHFEPRQAQKLDPYSQIALIAARQAVAQAGFAAVSPPSPRVAVIVGSAMAGKTTDDDNHKRLWGAVAEGRQAASHPMAIPRYIGNAAASQIGMEFGFTGPTFSISASCASGAQAVGQAFWLIRAGAADAAIAGGSDIGSAASVRRAWEGRGTMLSDGAGMMILESADSAAARGVPPLAEIAGFGMATNDRDAAIRAALDEAGLSEAEEAAPIADKIGHTLGASGVLTMIAAIGTLKAPMLCTCFAFGGFDTALVLK